MKDLSIIQVGNNCKKFRASGAQFLRSSIFETGWTPNSRIIRTDNGDGTLKLVDGRHRIEAIKLLSDQERISIFPHGVVISVYNKFTDEEELAVSIAANATTYTVQNNLLRQDVLSSQRQRFIGAQ